MKPKYYSCFFLSLFACGQGNIQDTDRKDNLLDGPASTKLINNFCKKVKDTYDENDPSACVESINKLVGKYANNFWSLERCQGIFKQLCEQVPSYPSQIVYDVLYALLKNKCLDAVGVRTIIQGIEENNPKVFSSLKNSVEKKFKTCNQGTGDYSASIITESFGFILNKTIFIPGINTFTSTPIPQQKKEITIDDLTNIWQCVRFIINNNGFDTNSLKKLIKLASSEDFNEAIKAIADAGILFKDSGDDMMKAFDEENVNLNNTGLKALANCIDELNNYEITSGDNLKHLFTSLKNCTDLAPIFKKCTNAVQVDGKFLSKLAEKCPENYHNLIESIDKTHFDKNDGKKDGYLQFLEKYHNVNTKGLSPLFSKLLDFFPVADFIKLLKNIDLNRATFLDPLIKSLKGKKFNLECLKQLIDKHQDNSDTFNIVINKINKGSFDKDAKGDEVIQAFDGKNIQLEDDNLTKILSMIGWIKKQKISNCQTAIDFCYQNIKNLNGKNIKAVFEKVKDDKKFDLNDLVQLWEQGEKKFNKILPYIPETKLKQDNQGNDVIDKIIEKNIELNKNTLPQVLLMIDKNQKISAKKNKEVFQICRDNKFNKEDINRILAKCADNLKFDLDCLKLYNRVYSEQLNTVLAAIPDDKFNKKNNGNVVVKTIKNKEFDFDEGKLKKVLLLCQGGEITNVNSLYFVFSRSWNFVEDVKALDPFVGNNSLNGNGVISKIDGAEPEAQTAFVKKFYSKIQDHTITISNKNIAEKFVCFAYILYGQANDLTDLKKKIKTQANDHINSALKKDKLKKFGGEDKEYNDFDAFKKKLSEVLKLNE